MADTVRLVDPRRLMRNPENPRLIFRQEELDALEDSIAKQGILVPLTVFEGGRDFILLDGERRWRCALKLALSAVPVIVQPKPDRLQNIMMMFAIHNARRDWDPLPTALKLQELEAEYKRLNGRVPTEVELAGLASLSRGEVRRLKKLLSLPPEYQQELMDELARPRSEQVLTVNHVLEVTRGAESLRKRGIVPAKEEDHLRRALLDKYRRRVERNTVAPRKLARLSRAVERGEVSVTDARRVVRRLVNQRAYSIDDAFRDSVEQADYEHTLEQLAQRLEGRLDEHIKRGYRPSPGVSRALEDLISKIRRFLRH